MSKKLNLTEFSLSASLPQATQDLARNLDDGIFDEEAKRGIGVCTLLEEQDDSRDLPADHPLRGTDAFQRLLMAYDVRTRDDFAAGRPASTVDQLFQAGGGRGALLFPVWCERVARERMQQSFDRFYSSTHVSDANGALRPHNLARTITGDDLQVSILPLLVGLMELGDGKPYSSFHMSEDANRTRMRRRGEFTRSAVYTLTGSERTHRFIETGIEIDISYKALREYALPALEMHIRWIGQRNDRDKEQVAYETHLLGDGSSAAATNTNVTSLSGGVAGSITTAQLLEFMRLYEADGNYAPSIALSLSAVMSIFDQSTFGSAEHPTFGPLSMAMLASQAARPEARSIPPMYARSYSVSNKSLFADRATLRMKYVPLLVERDRVIDAKFEKIVITEETAFDHLRDGGRRTLDVNN